MKSAPAKKKTKLVHPKATFTFRHNVLPPLLGILMALGVMGLLNGQWIGAQFQYYLLPTHSATLEPVNSVTLNPNTPARIMIPSVGITAPFVTSETSYDAGRVETALRSGIVHYGTTALPGQPGNVVALGHSSGQLWSPGHYKYAFTLLNKVKLDSRVYIDYKGTRYVYRVFSHKVVDPTDLSVVQHTDIPELTMITCTPVGVSSHRLVLQAVQISPAPAKAPKGYQPSHPITATKLPQ